MENKYKFLLVCLLGILTGFGFMVYSYECCLDEFAVPYDFVIDYPGNILINIGMGLLIAGALGAIISIILILVRR